MNEVIVTTRSGLRGLRFFPAMLLATVRVRRQLAGTPGVVRWASVLGGPREFWTITVWRSRHEMQEFMRSGAHGELMWLFARWLRSFWLMRWGPGAARVGSWDGLSLASGGAAAAPRAPFVLDDVRRPRADLSDAGAAVVRIRTSVLGLPRALRELRSLRGRLRRDPRLLRSVLGVESPTELYLFGVWSDRETAAAFVRSDWMRLAAARWGDGLWAQEWLPENEFGHWDGLRIRAGRRVSAGRRRVPATANEGGAMAQPVTEPRELLLEQLAEMLYVERSLANEVLPKLHEEVENRHFREALEEHLAQTREHGETIERVFDVFGEEPRVGPSPPFDGLKRQQDELGAKVRPGDLRDLYNAGAAAHTEHFEISAYHSLITLASILGEPDAVRLLEQNLHDEEAALEKVEKSLPEELTTELVT